MPSAQINRCKSDLKLKITAGDLTISRYTPTVPGVLASGRVLEPL